MRLFVLAIRDRALDAFGTPLCVQSVAAGVRSFTDEVNRAAEDNQLYKHPEDFDLYLVGHFETSDGQLQAEGVQMVAVGKDVVRVSQ